MQTNRLIDAMIAPDSISIHLAQSVYIRLIGEALNAGAFTPDVIKAMAEGLGESAENVQEALDVISVTYDDL